MPREITVTLTAPEGTGIRVSRSQVNGSLVIAIDVVDAAPQTPGGPPSGACVPDVLPAAQWAAIEQAVLREINRRGPIARAVVDLVSARLLGGLYPRSSCVAPAAAPTPEL